MTSRTRLVFSFTFVLLCAAVPAFAQTCTAPDDCDLDKFCSTPLAECNAVGTCEDRPPACPDVWIPVCGCDGLTYSNECYANFAGVSVLSNGQCSPASCASSDDCPVDEFCSKSTGQCGSVGLCQSRPGACPEVWDPVCGCDGITHANECYANLAGVSVANAGECPPQIPATRGLSLALMAAALLLIVPIVAIGRRRYGVV